MRRAAVMLVALLAACSAEKPPEPAPTVAPTVAEPRTLIAADFDPASLGAKILGPRGADPESTITAGGEEIARVASYVACPKGMATCVPAELPAGTVLTYVHTIVPAPPSPAASVSPAPADGTPAAVPPALFRMTRPAPGFNGGLGYDRAQAEAALGAPDPITVTLDAGQLIWRVAAGSGWKPGAPVTFWWQTTAPPAGPQYAFQLELTGQAANAKAPFPAAEKPVDPSTRR